MPVTRQRELIGWPLFFILSLLLHLLALLLWPGSSISLAEQHLATTLAVTLESGTAAPAPAAPARERPRPSSSPPPQPTAPAAAKAPPDTTGTVAAAPPPDTQRLTGNSLRAFADSQSLALVPPATAAPADNDLVSAQIRTRFADHFVYPLLAQRNGWEGEVLLGFHVASDGTLSDIQIIRSSGYALLDEAALASMRAIGRVEFGSGVVLRRTLELRIPVVYHLARR